MIHGKLVAVRQGYIGLQQRRRCYGFEDYQVPNKDKTHYGLYLSPPSVDTVI